jgi:hypothetical protein
MINEHLKKSVIFFLGCSTFLLSGCEGIFTTKNYVKSFFHEEVVFFYASSDYPNEVYDSKELPPRQTTLIFGPYMPNLGDGGGFGGNYHPYEGPMEGEEVVAFWQVPIKDKALWYYVRSEPNKGIIREPRDGHRAYNVGIALGPMRTDPTGLTQEQHLSAEIVHRNIVGKPILYRWGEWDKLYYVTGIFDSSDLKEIPREFHEIQGIAITAEQYDKLYKRCHGEWETVKCFMDESFPDLTAEQLEYIQSRKHPNDDDRLAGKFPKPEPYVNRFL